MGTVRANSHVSHGVKDAALYGLEAVPGVRQGASDDHAHGVIQIAAAHFLFEADGESFFGERGHGRQADGKGGEILR